MERKFAEELRWQTKQTEHYKAEYEINKTRRKEVEEAFDTLKSEMERKLKEAANEIEVVCCKRWE
jgi:hypothetical protein